MDQDSPEFLTARAAAERLGVKLQTLYAYTSRGLLRSVPGGQGPSRLYPRADVERLHARDRTRRQPPPPGGAPLRFGEPSLDSSITWLSETDGPVYRGHPALALAARDVPFEAAAELLWSGELPATLPRWDAEDLGLSIPRIRGVLPAKTPALAFLPVFVAALGSHDPDRFDSGVGAVLPRARRLLRRCAAALALVSDSKRIDAALGAPSVAESLALALGVRVNRRSVAAINKALVLLADHELNASTYAARVAASTHSDIYSCVNAGLAALAGPRHGAASERVFALIREIGRPEHAAEVLRDRMRRAENIPGFGHTVYRQQDPRAQPLLQAARALAPRSLVVRTVDATVSAMRTAGRPHANVDTALVALAGALGIGPVETPALFAIARMAGWIAHALEQYEVGFIIRPRARYLEQT